MCTIDKIWHNLGQTNIIWCMSAWFFPQSRNIKLNVGQAGCLRTLSNRKDYIWCAYYFVLSILLVSLLPKWTLYYKCECWHTSIMIHNQNWFQCAFVCFSVHVASRFLLSMLKSLYCVLHNMYIMYSMHARTGYYLILCQGFDSELTLRLDTAFTISAAAQN